MCKAHMAAEMSRIQACIAAAGLLLSGLSRGFEAGRGRQRAWMYSSQSGSCNCCCACNGFCATWHVSRISSARRRLRSEACAAPAHLCYGITRRQASEHSLPPKKIPLWPLSAKPLATHSSPARLLPFSMMACLSACMPSPPNKSQRVLVHAVQCKQGIGLGEI